MKKHQKIRYKGDNSMEYFFYLFLQFLFRVPLKRANYVLAAPDAYSDRHSEKKNVNIPNKVGKFFPFYKNNCFTEKIVARTKISVDQIEL